MSCQLIETSNAAAKAVAPGARLSEGAETALRGALEAEYHAGARYAAYVADHGEVAPFAKLLKAERRHAAAIATLMKAYGLPVPKNDWGSEARPLDALPDSTEAACLVCAEARIAQLRLYDETLIPAVAGVPGLADVFSALRDRLRDRHLPALQRGAQIGHVVPHLHGHSHGPSHHHSHGQGSGGCGHHRCGQAHAKGH